MVSSRRLKHTLLSTMPAARIDPDGIAPDARFTAEVDNAVYFCCLEAMQNCAKYAPGAAIHVALGTPDFDWLTFSVRDEGPGFDTAVSATRIWPPAHGGPTVSAGWHTQGDVGTRSGHEVTGRLPVAGHPLA
jgi:hypothetical protein